MATGSGHVAPERVELQQGLAKSHQGGWDGYKVPMLHIKFCGNRPTGSGEEDF